MNLTEEQKEKLPMYYEKWIGIGLSTDDCDRKEAEKWATEAYREQDLPAPEVFIWTNCPLTCCIAQDLAFDAEAILLRKNKGGLFKKKEEVTDEFIQETIKKLAKNFKSKHLKKIDEVKNV